MSGNRVLTAVLARRTSDQNAAAIAIALSDDGGSTWTEAEISIPGAPGQLRAAINGLTAAILVQHMSSANFSVADILVSKKEQIGPYRLLLSLAMLARYRPTRCGSLAE
jgi:hypothetical protein